MKRVMVTWTEHTRETKVFEVDDDDPVILGDLYGADVEALITDSDGHSKSYAVEEREIIDAEVIES